ncbi:hypothetical protein K469DRAFT_745637 [Zopfia rhizophila CBS 207.26]|uniref:C2H2-type domain-containing protein n=1 Tax=Zopfia rhizophila CBS 207.26 TaxID=1314779 RepID=A0A6A6ELC7_9PEZI|nr:hypothetical protein K469DRAFT_745637 [Zopfia rhizophila CBS 207.26]
MYSSSGCGAAKEYWNNPAANSDRNQSLVPEDDTYAGQIHNINAGGRRSDRERRPDVNEMLFQLPPEERELFLQQLEHRVASQPSTYKTIGVDLALGSSQSTINPNEIFRANTSYVDPSLPQAKLHEVPMHSSSDKCHDVFYRSSSHRSDPIESGTVPFATDDINVSSLFRTEHEPYCAGSFQASPSYSGYLPPASDTPKDISFPGNAHRYSQQSSNSFTSCTTDPRVARKHWSNSTSISGVSSRTSISVHSAVSSSSTSIRHIPNQNTAISSAERPYQCTNNPCNLRFKTPADLKRHQTYSCRYNPAKITFTCLLCTCTHLGPNPCTDSCTEKFHTSPFQGRPDKVSEHLAKEHGVNWAPKAVPESWTWSYDKSRMGNGWACHYCKKELGDWERFQQSISEHVRVCDKGNSTLL